ncbi:hypothetical protein RBH29_01420 [Herbivorax sp. ANBcel31]|nr:hypothetical protein [Herbivorax sp. ANBcel31]MDQ2085096.1 hypothetical protein [Herbivorax sp. ANBcel31]
MVKDMLSSKFSEESVNKMMNAISKKDDISVELREEMYIEGYYARMFSF